MVMLLPLAKARRSKSRSLIPTLLSWHLPWPNRSVSIIILD